MDISIKRDGLTLRGELLRTNNEKSSVAIIFHGFMSSIRNKEGNILSEIADRLIGMGVSVIRFDFEGHGKSDGNFSDMNVYSEILDAAKIIDYARSLPFVTDIYIIGHSQGALVEGMAAGYYRECIKKLVMLAPAATIKDDALNGNCFGVPYDAYNIPDYFPVTNIHNEHFEVGGLYFRIAKTLPIYETTAMFEGKTLIIHGTNDTAVRVSGAERYLQYMPNAILELIEGETHGLNTFSPEQTAERVVKF